MFFWVINLLPTVWIYLGFRSEALKRKAYKFKLTALIGKFVTVLRSHSQPFIRQSLLKFSINAECLLSIHFYLKVNPPFLFINAYSNLAYLNIGKLFSCFCSIMTLKILSPLFLWLSSFIFKTYFSGKLPSVTLRFLGTTSWIEPHHIRFYSSQYCVPFLSM